MHAKKFVTVVATLGLLTLSACGGGGGGGSANDQSLWDKWQKYANGTPTLKLSASELLTLYNNAARQQTHETNGRLYDVDPGKGAWVAPPHGHISTYSQSGDLVDSWPPGYSFKSVLKHKSVTLAEVKYDMILDDDGDSIKNIGASDWGLLEYSQFGVEKEIQCWGASFASCSESSLGSTSRLSISTESSGHYSRVNPSGLGSAVWNGVMTGVDVSSYEPGITRRVLGNARIDIDDLSNPDVDVAFTGIRDLVSETARPDMTWNDLALTNGGFSDAGAFTIGSVGVPPSPTETIRGMFYGPAQQEVGGVFDSDGITGAFGATRE